MKDGIYSNDELGVFGLFIDGECVLMSTERNDCIEEAKRLGKENI